MDVNDLNLIRTDLAGRPCIEIKRVPASPRHVYGQPIGVNYRADDHFRTKLGACVSILKCVFLIFNLISLREAFHDDSR